jgi:AcrR family transcriptional regulator
MAPGSSSENIDPPRPNDRRAQIVDAAMRLFAEHGVARASMRALADAVGIKAASLYNHFASKDEIIDAVVERGVRRLDDLKRYRAGLGETRPTEVLRSCIEYWFRLGELNQEIVILFAREPLLLDAARRDSFMESTRGLIAFFEGLLEEGVRAGEFRVANPTLLAFSIWGLELAWILRGELPPGATAIDEYATQQAELILRQIT